MFGRATITLGIGPHSSIVLTAKKTAQRCNGLGVGLAVKRLWLQLPVTTPGFVTTLGKMFTPLCPLPSSMIWYRSTGHDALQLGR